MATTAGGIGFLVVIGLMAVGYSEAGWGSTGVTAEAGTLDDDTLDDGTLDDGTSTCDSVLVVDTEAGSARMPADSDGSDETTTTACTMDVERGDGDAVAALQQALAQCHGQAVTVDGEYGAETAGAVAAVQQDAGIATDGEYGPATMAVMRWPVDGSADASGTPDCVGSPADSGDKTSALPATR